MLALGTPAPPFALPEPAAGATVSLDELIVFMIAGHDTTATTLSYALWALGHHHDPGSGSPLKPPP